MEEIDINLSEKTSEETLEKLANLANFCMSEPDAGLELIETIVSKEPELESELFLKLCKAMAYKSKAFQMLRNRIPSIDGIDLDELVDKVIQNINDEELNYLEKALSEIRQIENVDPEYMGKIGTEEERIGEYQVEAIATIIERRRPGRVSQILGKLKLRYLGPDRIKFSEHFPEDENIHPFLDVFFTCHSVIKSAFILAAGSRKGREYIFVTLYSTSKVFNEWGKSNPIVDMVYLFKDGTFYLGHLPKEDEKEGLGKKLESEFCFIATTVYRTPYASEVQMFKKFRDEFLLPKGLGRLFVSCYYRVSPVLASVIDKSKLVQRFTKLVILKPILWLIRIYRHVPDERIERDK